MAVVARLALRRRYAASSPRTAAGGRSGTRGSSSGAPRRTARRPGRAVRRPAPPDGPRRRTPRPGRAISTRRAGSAPATAPNAAAQEAATLPHRSAAPTRQVRWAVATSGARCPSTSSAWRSEIDADSLSPSPRRGGRRWADPVPWRSRCSPERRRGRGHRAARPRSPSRRCGTRSPARTAMWPRRRWSVPRAAFVDGDERAEHFGIADQRCASQPRVRRAADRDPQVVDRRRQFVDDGRRPGRRHQLPPSSWSYSRLAVSWLPDRCSPPPSNPGGRGVVGGPLLGDSCGTAPDSHRCSRQAGSMVAVRSIAGATALTEPIPGAGGTSPRPPARPGPSVRRGAPGRAAARRAGGGCGCRPGSARRAAGSVCRPRCDRRRWRRHASATPPRDRDRAGRGGRSNAHRRGRSAGRAAAGRPNGRRT